MKKFMTWFCIIMQMLIIGMGNLCVVVLITTAYADTVGYYGFWNVPVFLIVGGIVGVTLNVYMRSVQKFSTEL